MSCYQTLLHLNFSSEEPLSARVFRALMSVSGSCNATDQQDKLYRLHHRLRCSNSVDNVADIHKTTYRILYGSCSYLIEEHGLLEVLQSAPGSIAGLSSWVPSWDRRPCPFRTRRRFLKSSPRFISHHARIFYMQRQFPLGPSLG